MKNSVYLDHNATTPLRPNARSALHNAQESPLNASAVHSYGRMGRKLIEDARAHLANTINCPAAQIIFNSGATEGNNTVLQHFAHTYPDEHIIIGATEHPSVYEAIPAPIITPVTHDGDIDLTALEKHLKNKVSLVSIMIANNETGIIHNIKAISDLTHKHGALLHCDGTQALGKTPLDMQQEGIDFLTLSSHKIGGPQGVGALAIGLCGITPTLLNGGGQEKKARAGTENVAGIAGFGSALQDASANISKEAKRLSTLQNKLEQGITAIAPQAIIHGQGKPRLPNTTFISLPGLQSETALMAFDLEGIAISNGSACSSGTVKQSHVLTAMGCPPDIATSALRISTGWNTTSQDIDAALKVWEKITKGR